MDNEKEAHASLCVNHDGDGEPQALQSGDGQDTKPDYSSKATNKTTFSDYARIFTYSTLGDRILISLAALAQIGTGTTLPLMNIIFGKLVGNFGNYFIPGSTTTKAEFQHSVNNQTLYIVYIFVARWTLAYLSMFAFRITGLRMSARLRLEYLRALFSLSISVLDTLPTGQASNTLTNTANVLQIGISEKLGTFFQFTSLLITAIIIAFTYSWSLTLVTSSVLVFIMIVYSMSTPIIVKMQKEVEHADEKASSIAGEVLASIRMIVACGAENRVSTKYSGWIQESKRRGLKMSPFIGIQFAPLFFVIFATMALCFWFGFKLYLERHITNIGSIVVVLMSAMMVAFSVSQTAGPIIAITKAATAATDFFAIIDAPKPKTTGLTEPDVSAREEISLECVTFAYPSRPHIKVLDNCSIRFEPGKITAIVGASGSGKSTIVGLLERWYDLNIQNITKHPESAPKDKKAKKETETLNEKDDESKTPIALGGKISIGSIGLNEVDLKWWRNQISLVAQEPYIFNETIYKNVEYGLIGSQWENEDAETKKRLVENACKEAFANEFIDRLPMGYETQVGDAGIKLSGGQRQRLAIARSIIKRPKILILDEATSSIDVRGERLVQAALDRVSEDKTTIVIAHRLSTIKKADKIVVLMKGKVIEEGNHESLLADENGAYWALVNAQKISMGEDFVEETDLTEALTQELTRNMSNASGEAIPTDEEARWEPKGFYGSFGLLLREQSYLWSWYIMLLIGCCGAASGYPLQAYLFAQLLNVVTLSGKTLQHASNHWSLMFFVLGLGSGAAYYILGHSSNNISYYVTSTYRQEYFENILRKPIRFYDDEQHSSGSLTALVANDPTQLQQMLGMNMSLVYVAILNLIGCIIISFYFGWKLTLVVGVVALPIILLGGFFRYRWEIQFEAMNQEVFSESSKFAAESIGAFRTVSSLALEKIICDRYERLLQNHVKKAFRKATYSTAIFSLSDSITMPCMALGFYYGGTLLASREYNITTFFVVYMAIVNGAEGAGSFLSFGPNLAQASAAANRILSFRKRGTTNNKESPQLQDTDGGVKIELKDLWFKYPTRDIPIFTGLNLTIEKGKFAALVGASGCGKTSIVSLLERFYDLQRGKILFNGVNIAELDIKKHREALSLVAQEPTLFQGTIKENILLGVDESTTTEELHQTCRDSEIHDFVMSLPDGYNTDVGSRGIALSGGQKQRIAIARALIRRPTVLLLDEATSSLDSESEKLVQSAFERAAKGRTMVVVAHRLATVQNADIIFVLGEGKVLETGDHSQLLKKRGVYYQMCQSQALDR